MLQRAHEMATGPNDELVRLTDARVREDGKAIAFRIERVDGETFDLSCSLPDLGDMFSYLGNAALHATAEEATQQQGASGPPPDLHPIPATGIAFAAGASSDHTLLVMKLHGFRMAFEIPSRDLVRLADEISQIARTLSAQGVKPN